MKELVRIIKELQNDTTKNGKQSIIKQNLNNQLFVEVMQFMCNPFIVTGISQKKINKTIYPKVANVNGLSELMEYLKANKTGRDLDIAVCMNFISTLETYEEVDLTMQIVTKSLKTGVDTLWNKTVPSELQVPEFGCMLAKSMDDHEDKIKGDFVITEKKDGLRVVIIKENGKSKAFSRTGKEYEGLEYILEEINNIDYLDNMVFDGELIAKTQGTTNEVFAETQSLARSKGKNKEGLTFHMFDMIPLDEFKKGQSKENAIKRKQNISRLMNDILFKNIVEVKPLYIGSDKEKIQRLMVEYVEPNGYEGLILNLDKPYVTRRTDSLLKVKKFKTCDIYCVGFESGEGRFSSTLGNIIVEYKGNKVGVGSGFSQEQRDEIWNNKNKYINQLCEVKYFEESMDSKTKNVSLRFPIFMRFRFDKTEVSYN